MSLPRERGLAQNTVRSAVEATVWETIQSHSRAGTLSISLAEGFPAATPSGLIEE